MPREKYRSDRPGSCATNQEKQCLGFTNRVNRHDERSKGYEGNSLTESSGPRPLLRRTLAAALGLAVCSAGVGAAALIPHERPACAIAADTPLPWMQDMRAGCGR